MQVLQRSRSIDGMRGFSVLLVIVGHLVAYRFPINNSRPLHEIGFSIELIPPLVLRILSPVGEIGVQIFFVISGYLITTLLIREESLENRISIRAFYIRRAFRILPAFGTFVLAALLLRNQGLIYFHDEAFIRSALFVCNISGYKCSWWFAHTWSLSAEEQFYLVWPVMFIVLGKKRELGLILLLMIFLLGAVSFWQLSSFACIAIGALTATSSRVQRILSKLATQWMISVSLAVLFFQALIPGGLFGGSLIHCVRAIGPILIAIVFFGTIASKGPLVPLANRPIIQNVGLISYSVYLWQQIGTAPEIWNTSVTGATSLYANYPILASLFIVPAVISYFFIERPFINRGRRLSDHLIYQSAKESAHKEFPVDPL